MFILGLGLGLVGLLAAMAISHPDDPKLKDRKPRFEGPGWRAIDRGLPPQFPAVGVKLESWLSLPDFGSATSANDCWGYVSPSGHEYAILGLSNGTAFVNITQPSNPTILAQFAGPTSVWRDIKTYEHYAYVVSEGGGGIQVFDLSDIDGGVITQLSSVTTGGSTATHNVAVDTDSGFLYRCGGDGNGLRIYDLANPAEPVFVAGWPDRYVHDAQIRTMNITGHPDNPRQIAFCCSGLNHGWVETGVDILDVTDKNNIVPIARHFYPNAAYSHQAWLSPDNQFLYLNDEVSERQQGNNSTLVIIDVSDVQNPVTLNPVTNHMPAVTHNLYARDNLIFASNYTSGLRVLDATDSMNPVEVGYFDTAPESSADTYNGLWSNFPYFPSGTVIGSDIERGLFVWTIEVNQLSITMPAPHPDLLDWQGDVITFEVAELDGQLDQSNVRVIVDAGDGPVHVPAIARGSEAGLFDASLPAMPCGATVRWYIEAETEAGVVVRLPGEAPHAVFTSYAADAFDILVADDFELESGWSTSDDGATAGQWERGVPVNDPTWAHGPMADADGSGKAWLTENQMGNSDVDNGSVALTTTTWDFSDRQIEIGYWYFLKLTDDNGADALVVEISPNGDEGPWTEIARHERNQGRSWQWHGVSPDELEAFGVVPGSQTMLRFTANDADPQSIVEAGIDGLRIRAIVCVDPPIPGDVNGDGAVNVLDLLEVIANWGADGSAGGDANGDGVVNVLDLLIVVGNWGAGS